ncbi:MAG: sodium:calcium antiporter, partial [Candidatus Magasanikbacteria bacterium]|nr:sodium:calcium antiporter [Candidatus Magasanikbacteria bacterium]
SRADGMIFLLFFIIFLYHVYGISKVETEKEEVETYNWSTSLFMFAIGIVGLVLGGKWIVDNAIILATQAGLSERIIGLTIVAIGTSLPELATTVSAIRQGHTDLAIGNAIGSNIFNVFWILGITALIKPLPFNVAINTDVLFTCFITFLLFAFMFIGPKHQLKRWQGWLFVLLYITYIAFAIIRA